VCKHGAEEHGRPAGAGAGGSPLKKNDCGDGPKAALLVRNGKLGGTRRRPSLLTSGLRSERFNPPPIGSSRTGRQARPAAHQKSGRLRRHGQRPEEGRARRRRPWETPRGSGDPPALCRKRGTSRVVLQCTLRCAPGPGPGPGATRFRLLSDRRLDAGSTPHRHEESPSQLQHRKGCSCTPFEFR